MPREQEISDGSMDLSSIISLNAMKQWHKTLRAPFHPSIAPAAHQNMQPNLIHHQSSQQTSRMDNLHDEGVYVRTGIKYKQKRLDSIEVLLLLFGESIERRMMMYRDIFFDFSLSATGSVPLIFDALSSKELQVDGPCTSFLSGFEKEREKSLDEWNEENFK